MKNNKGFGLVAVLIITVIVLAVGGGAYYLGTKNGSISQTPVSSYQLQQNTQNVPVINSNVSQNENQKSLPSNNNIVQGKCGDYKIVKVASKDDTITGQVNGFNYSTITANIDINTVGSIIIPNSNYFIYSKDYDVLDSSNLLKSGINIKGYNTITVKVKNDVFNNVPVGPYNPRNLKECMMIN